MAICAYCKNDKKLTREHVIPNFMYKYQKENFGKYKGWNEKAGKMIEGELIVKDVCSDCNNVKLGDLDGYSQSFLTKNRIMVPNFTSASIDLVYDYHLLLRWLLKVSFNSSRAASSHPQLFQKYIPYILGGDSSECEQDLFLIAGLVKPKVLSESELSRFKSDAYSVSRNRELNPFHVRISVAEHGDDSFIVRTVILGAIMFFIPIFKTDMKIGFKKSKVRSFLKSKRNLVLLERNKSRQLINQLDLDFVTAYSAQMLRVRS